MLVQLTNAGAALLNANNGPIQISTFKLGSAYGYIPSPGDTDIHGSMIYTGVPSQYFVVNANVVKYSAYLDYNIGPFQFGEIGLYTSTGVLFALGANDQLLSKIPLSQTGDNSIRMDVYLSMVNQNYQMWLDYAESNNQFHMAVLGSVDQLPPPSQATPNAYVITGASSQQSSFLAYTDRAGLWNFDAYAYADQAQATIVGFDSQSVTIALSDYVSGMTPAYFGEVIAEFSTGALYGICRYIKTVVQSGGTVTLGFDNSLMALPSVGDKIIVFGRQQLSTTIPNLPIASTTTLGAIKVGTSLTIAGDGTLNVAATSYPVLSVNGKTGNVVLTATDLTGFALVATTGKYSDLIGAPAPYTLPIATTATLGGVKGPSTGNLTIAGDGTIDLGFPAVKTVNGTAPNGSGDVVLNIPADVIGLITPTRIASGANFNTYTAAGMFFLLDADAASVTNGPNTTAGGVLDVEPFTTTASGGDVLQRYTQSTAMYIRRYTQSNGNWSPWVQTQTTGTQPVATTTTLGVVQVGTGLNVTSGGILSTQIQSVNGKNNQFITLTASDVSAIPLADLDAAGGVPQLDATTTTPVPATDPYTFGRMRFWENTLGIWFNAGTWDANANRIIQSKSGLATYDANQTLLANGQQHIDISYNGNGRAGLTAPDYQTVSGEGMVYQVGIAGTTSLDGNAQWDVGDLVVGINGKWTKVTINFTNVVFSAGTF